MHWSSGSNSVFQDGSAGTLWELCSCHWRANWENIGSDVFTPKETLSLRMRQFALSKAIQPMHHLRNGAHGARGPHSITRGTRKLIFPEWWGHCKYGGFNLSYVSNNIISKCVLQSILFSLSVRVICCMVTMDIKNVTETHDSCVSMSWIYKKLSTKSKSQSSNPRDSDCWNFEKLNYKLS